MQNILVSVIIPFYKNNLTIRRAVNSALRQKDIPLEIIIVDDGGTLDRNRFRFDKADASKIRIITLPNNRGVAYARNVGVKAAKGAYVAFLDADDWWTEDKLVKQFRLIHKYALHGKEPVICFTGRRLCTKAGVVTDKYIHAPERIHFRELLKHNAINCSSVLIQRKTALAHPMRGNDLHEDYLCWLEILRRGGFAVGIDEPLLYYRLSGNSKSGNKIKSAVMTFRVYHYLNLPFFEMLYYFSSYAINGIKKYW